MKEIRKLEELIKHHKALYYQGRPEINDSKYDQLEEDLKSLDPDNQALKIVGSSLKGSLEKIKHDTKMLSLAKTYKESELEKWKGEEKLISTHKIDGVSCSLIYSNEKLIISKTRGDGIYGENILNKIRWIGSIPSEVSLQNDVEIRGELFIREKEFFNLSLEMEEMGLDRPTSQRNIVAGLISRKGNIELCRHIEFMAFDLIEKNIQKDEVDKFKKLEKEKFAIPDFRIISTKEEISETVNAAREFINEGDYQIDGIVFTYNNTQLHEELGATAHHPRYKMAFKFEGETKKAVIRKITWSVSRNGILTPVALIDPVELSGATITRVTLHNYGLVKQFELKAEDHIEIVRSGEVIPKFLSVLKSSKNKLEIPEKCPSCGDQVKVEEIRLICSNEDCPAQKLESILNFIKKIGIDDISSKRLEEMIRVKLVDAISDLYLLEKNDFLKLDKVKDKLAEKFLETIQKSKQADLQTFLSALGINGGAYNKCDKVVQAGFDTIPLLKAMTAEKLSEVESFAEKSATEFVKSFQQKIKLVENLLKIGFSFKPQGNKESFFSGKRICITGSLSEKRSVIEALVRSEGARVVTSVSKNTDLLLTNDPDSQSSKAKKAKELNIQMISEADFFLKFPKSE